MINDYYSKSSLSVDTLTKGEIFGTVLSEDDPFTPLGTINTLEGIPMIEQSIRDILLTPKGSRFMMPDYGCELHSLLGCNQTSELLSLAHLYTYIALRDWEKRITVQKIDCAYNKRDVVLVIDIYYKLNSLDTLGKYTFYYDLDEGVV